MSAKGEKVWLGQCFLSLWLQGITVVGRRRTTAGLPAEEPRAGQRERRRVRWVRRNRLPRRRRRRAPDAIGGVVREAGHVGGRGASFLQLEWSEGLSEGESEGGCVSFGAVRTLVPVW